LVTTSHSEFQSKKGDTLEGVYGDVLHVDDNILLFEEEDFMHLNCENSRFVMGNGIIGHNFPACDHFFLGIKKR